MSKTTLGHLYPSIFRVNFVTANVEFQLASGAVPHPWKIQSPAADVMWQPEQIPQLGRLPKDAGSLRPVRVAETLLDFRC